MHHKDGFVCDSLDEKKTTIQKGKCHIDRVQMCEMYCIQFMQPKTETSYKITRNSSTDLLFIRFKIFLESRPKFHSIQLKADTFRVKSLIYISSFLSATLVDVLQIF